MTIPEILKSTDHRPWKMPSGDWSFYQEWNQVLFIHFQVDAYELEKYVPKELEIDLFDGKPWVSVVAFTMEKIRPRLLPSFSPISNFDEINIRTYVRSNGKSGVYFLSIEGGKIWSCKIARALSGLPYRFSKMERLENHYISHNTGYQDSLRIKFQPEGQISEKTDLEIWLTERYALFQDTDKHIHAFELHHLEWTLNALNIIDFECDYPRFSSFLGGNPHLSHFSSGVKVLAWGKQQIQSSFSK